MIETKQLKYFVTAAESGSFSRAAEQLFTTQSNVSKVISSLEDSLDVMLFVRGKNGILLTTPAVKFYRRAAEILENIEQLERTVKMGEIRDIPFQNEPADVKSKVKEYWTKRADGFQKARHEEIHSEQARRWHEEIVRNVSIRKGIRILDVGCGAGFFEAVLGPDEVIMTGIDLTPDMIEKAGELAQRHGISAEFYVMDAENPAFPDETFDLVLSRNLTWTLPDPVHAYTEWHRVLKPGGTLLNFDAEYARNFHTFNQNENIAHHDLSEEMIDECHDIYHMLSISALRRPAWDETVLREIGFSKITTDLLVSTRIYREKNEFYVPDPVFSICAVK